jgi:hypothetical protein
MQAQTRNGWTSGVGARRLQHGYGANGEPPGSSPRLPARAELRSPRCCIGNDDGRADRDFQPSRG